MKALDNIHRGRMPLKIAVGITMIMLLLASGIGTAKGESEIEMAYDDGSAEGYWSIGSMYDYSDWYNGGRSGHAVSFSPCSSFFSIDSIKVFGRRYGDDHKIRMEVWDQNRNIVYSNISNSSDYFSTTSSWVYIDVSSIDISGDFYVVLFTSSTGTDGTSIGYDTSSSINRSYVVENNTEFIWALSSPQETTNWMIRAVGILGDADTTLPTLTIASPTDGTTVSTSTITVTGTAIDDTGVTSLTVNGAPVIPDTDGSFTTTVSLTSGVNSITVIATDAAGNSATETVTVTASLPYLVFAITPNSRLAQVGTPVTIFLSVINSGTGNATAVSISQASSLPATIGYQAWDGATLTGSPDTLVDIPAGEAAHFVLTINATAEFDSSPMTFNVSGTNAVAASISSVNTLTMSSSAVPYADIIMMSTSLDMGMTVNTAAAFAIATSNVGSADATGVNLIVDVPSTITGLVCQVNETNPDGSIKGPATGLTIPVGGQPTFAVFLTPTQAIDYDPANNRIVLKLVDGSGKVVGAQSVAVSAVVA